MKEKNRSNLIWGGRTLHKIHDKDLIELIHERNILRMQLDSAKESLHFIWHLHNNLNDTFPQPHNEVASGALKEIEWIEVKMQKENE